MLRERARITIKRIREVKATRIPTRIRVKRE
jgi:hypothetical protein